MSGKTKDRTLGSCARQMWLEAACRDHTFKIYHKPGAELILADALSRFYSDPKKKSLALSELKAKGLTLTEPVLSNYVFFDHNL